MDFSMAVIVALLFIVFVIGALWVKELASKKDEGNSQGLSVSEEFEKIWESADYRALRAWTDTQEKVPVDTISDEAKKFIDEKRDKYICDMLTMKQLREE
jgi:hypothetical protein